ncbi:DUF397 domain-containing protein [Nocardia sp. NPDC048505]|uniref:DUF397 domain-containing protein n=1 Tax=unclassified Nocardia TaxID=2637762 RepID=UPI0033FF2E9A
MSADLSGERWFKASYSGDKADCVEVAFLDAGAVGVRDSKNPSGDRLVFTTAEWAAFTAGVAAGRFGGVD